ncbi:MAG: glycosyltransferase [Niabella sp.]|nr:MAG: glycosyltransferase [Niabella sp.]
MSVIDIIVPVKNEEKNIQETVAQIDQALSPLKIEYRIIFAVDQSTDNTVKKAKQMQKTHPVIIHLKQGKGGKGYSILEALDLATAEYVAFIDGDLQYDPKHLPEMLEKLQQNPEVGVVIAQRKNENLSKYRAILSELNAFVVGKLLLNMDLDIQSGMKVFRRSIAPHINKTHVTAWTFDIPLLHAARELGYKFDSVIISFNDRKHGASKVGILKTANAIISCALKTKFTKRKVYELDPNGEFEKGIIYKNKSYLTHTQLSYNKSAIFTFVRSQKIGFIVIVGFLLAAFILFRLQSAIWLVAIVSTIYFLDVVFNIFVILKSLHFPPEFRFNDDEIAAVKDNKLPVYTVLCPLYKESAVLPFFVKNIGEVNWPKDKLEVLLLLEENDQETITTAQNMDLPPYVKIVVVPHSMPKTKPKACNYGLLKAQGDYIVIYDAEDNPDRDQLKKAYLAFKSLGENTVCVQAKLNYFNVNDNLLTRLFTAEYSLWFDVILPGLQSISTTIPLGGTSNHFITKKLRELHGWDPFNVTEDCDLGARLFKEGYTTAIIDSTTLEEANSNVKNWIRQRSRWIKGYMQTYIVHMRNPITFFRTHGYHALIFQLIIGLRITFILLNPFLWATTISYFAFYKYVGPSIELLFPPVVFYMAVISLIFGNFIYLYNYMIGCAKRGHWTLMKFIYLIPVYWMLMFLAAVMATQQLIFKPHHWEKTNHGLHLLDKKKFSLFGWIKDRFPKKNSPKPTLDEAPTTPTPAEEIDIEAEILAQPLLNKSESSKIKNLISAVLSKNGEIILVVSMLLGNLLNYIYSAYLSRILSVEDFGVISLFGNFMFIASLFFSALSLTVSYESGYILGKYNKIISNFWQNTRRKFFSISVIFAIIWALSAPLMREYFQGENAIHFILFTPVWIIGTLAAIDYGYLNGSHKFKLLSLVILVEAFSKLFFTFAINHLIEDDYVYLAIPLSMLAALVAGYWFAIHIKAEKTDSKDKALIKFPKGFFASSVIYRFSIIAFISIDIILAKHYLTPTDAGYYALISLVGKMIFLLSSMVGQFLVPFISKSEGQKADSRKQFMWLFGITTFVGASTFTFFGLFGNITAPLLLGDKILPVINLLPIYSLGILLFTLSSTVIGFFQIKKNYLYPVISFLLSIVQIAALAHFSTGLLEFVYTMFAISAVNLIVTIIVALNEAKILTVCLNIKDFIDLFSELPSDHIPTNKKRVLILNWRDTKHTWAGGAEVYLHEISKCLIKNDIAVVMFCGNDQKSKRREVIDNVYIIRRGGQFTVYIWAFLYYIFRFRGQFDVIIDSENGIPFFSPIYANAPVVGLVHHVHREIIIKELDIAFYLKPVAHLARFLESNIMPIVYRNCQMITVSESTKKDMKKIGLGKFKETLIVNPGIDETKFSPAEKTATPTLLYLGRLKSYKSIEVAIHAVKKLVKNIPDIEFNIAGFGDHQPALEKLVSKLKLKKNVKFLGKVSEEEKSQLMAASWVFLYPSVWEGWGISAIEANASGTPVIASKVPGLIDSVKHRFSGYLVEYGDVNKFAEKIKHVITKPERRAKLEQDSLMWAKNFTWTDSSHKLINILTSEMALYKQKSLEQKNILWFIPIKINSLQAENEQP